jgi:hypothetical protein
VQRLLEQDALGGDQLVLLDCGSERSQQHGRRTGLGQKAKDLPVVDGGDGGVDLGLAGQQNPHRLRCHGTRLGQERGSVHARHAHVGHDHGPLRVALQQLEGLRAAERCLDLVAPAQGQRQPIE